MRHGPPGRRPAVRRVVLPCVYPTEPEANPLLEWITSLEEMQRRVPEDVLVLPAHGKPFRGAHLRLQELVAEHRDGLQKLQSLCTSRKRAVDVFPALFKARITGSNLMFAIGEAIAHLNYLLETGQMAVEADGDGVNWYQSLG